MVAENLNPHRSFKVKVVVESYLNFMSSRGTMQIEDTLPPMSSQLLAAFTQATSDFGSSVKWRINCEAIEGAEKHTPPLGTPHDFHDIVKHQRPS